MWAALPEGSNKKFDNAVMKIPSQVPEGYQVFCVMPDAGDAKNVKGAERSRALEAIEAALGKEKGSKFHPGHVGVWHMRTIPGHGHVIGELPWEKQASYTGPADRTVYAYSPKLAQEREDAAATKAAAEAKKASIQAHADIEKKAVDTKRVT